MQSHEMQFHNQQEAMTYALNLARRGQGYVEPNPCVGAVLVDEKGKLLSAGHHEFFGGPHAEVNALKPFEKVPADATLYVTLEPCNHFGKTPPCSELLIKKGVRKVIVGCVDPAPHVAGKGIKKLEEAGIQVTVGVLEEEVQELIAPFKTLHLKKRPFIHAKWAMTLDGKIASGTGHSKWITNEVSRDYAHELRGKMDAILTGIGTVLSDDPMLTARAASGQKFPRTPIRIVLDHQAKIPLNSKLVTTANEFPVIIFVSSSADPHKCDQLVKHGVEVIKIPTSDHITELKQILKILGEKQLTHLLIEAGQEILGSFFDGQLIDELHLFMAPKIVGGKNAKSPVGGIGLKEIPSHSNCRIMEQREFAGDYYFRARLDSL